MSLNDDSIRALVEALPVPLVVTSLADSTVVWANALVGPIFGLAPDEALGQRALHFYYDAGERAALLTTVAQYGRLRDYELRMKRVDGTPIWVSVNVEPLTFEGQECIVLAFNDISARLHAEQELRESEARFRTIVETAPVPMHLARTSDGKILYANSKVGQTVGKTSEEIVGTLSGDYYRHPHERELLMERLYRDGNIRGYELELVRANGETAWASINASLVNYEGEPAIVSTVLDITESRARTQRLDYLASHDALTGLANRRAFEQALNQALILTRQEGVQHALCYLDLDGFKVINDNCGHAAGDEFLKKLAQTLRKLLRKNDVLARLGGDELAILVRDCDLSHGWAVAEKIRSVVADLHFVAEGRDFHPGASIGLLPITTAQWAAADLIKAADSACYAAKRSGRNRVHLYAGEA